MVGAPVKVKGKLSQWRLEVSTERLVWYVYETHVVARLCPITSHPFHTEVRKQVEKTIRPNPRQNRRSDSLSISNVLFKDFPHPPLMSELVPAVQRSFTPS